MSNEMFQKKVPTSQLVFPNAENTTTNQLQNLLQIGAFALHALMRPGGSQHETSIPGVQPGFPKEAEIAAENTFIKVMANFDAILDDSARWSLAKQQALEADFMKAHALNMAYLEEQAEFARTMNAPHFRFKPQLLRLRDGRMLALLGSVDDLDNSIVGVGASAGEALKQFDETFNAGVPSDVMDWAKRREADLEAGKTPEPFKQKNNDKTDKTVDSRRNKPAPRAENRRKNPPGNS